MRLVSKRLALPLIAALAVTIAFAGAAPAATTSVTLKLKGEYGKRVRTACGRHKHFRVYHRGSTIEFKGLVTPHPVTHFPVVVEVKRCAHGQFRKFHTYHATGKRLSGKYKRFLRARGLAPSSHRAKAIVYYFARVEVIGGRSRKVFFAVTN